MPEEVLRLFSLAYDLQTDPGRVEHRFSDLLDQTRLFGCCLRSDPNVHDTGLGIVVGLEWHIEDVAESRVEKRCVRLDLDQSRAQGTAIAAQVIEFNSQLAFLRFLSVGPLSCLDNELPLEVTHELQVLLLLVDSDDFQRLTKHRLEFFLQREGEG